MKFCQHGGKLIHHLIVDPSCCRSCGLVQWGTLHIMKICSWRQKNNCTPHARQQRLCVWKIFESSLPRNESKPSPASLLWRSWEQWLNNFRIFRALITGSRSHFERSETVKTFTEVSQRHQRTQLCRAMKLKDYKKADSSRSTFRRRCWLTGSIFGRKEARKRKWSFHCALYNKSMYVTGLQD